MPELAVFKLVEVRDHFHEAVIICLQECGYSERLAFQSKTVFLYYLAALFKPVIRDPFAVLV